MTIDERYRLWLNFTLKADYNAQKKLLSAFDSPYEIFKSPSRSAINSLLGENKASRLKLNANEAYIDKCLEYLSKNHIGVTTCASEDYPRLLKNIDDPPFVLYYKGRIRSDIALPLAVIGSRKHSEHARRVTNNIVISLCECGACIISGMAIGIDGIAAKAALSTSNTYPTIAVLGSGIDVIYPDANKRLYYEIIERGAVISEFLPGTRPEKWNFPFRNRIISGMSLGVIVVEAREKSGTSITVNRALEQGRDVFAVPGRVNDVLCKGSNMMIQQGYAKMVFDVDDILSEYGIEYKRSQKRVVQKFELSMEQELICRLLQASERSFDELCIMTSFSSLSLNSFLTDLEFSGIIKQSPGRIYELISEFDV